MRALIICSILFAFISAALKMRQRPLSLKILCTFLGLTLVSELTALYLAYRFGNNMVVFHVFSPVLFVLLALYFQEISPTVRKRRLGYIVSVITVVISVVNSIWFQPITTMNSNYLLLEGLLGIGLILITMLDFLKNEDDLLLSRNIHFWVCIILLFQYTGTFIIYILIQYLRAAHVKQGLLLSAYYSLWGLAVLTYLSFAVSHLLFNPQKQQHG